jgi:hypothetical protein
VPVQTTHGILPDSTREKSGNHSRELFRNQVNDLRKFVLDSEEPNAFVFYPQLNVVGEASDMVLSRLMTKLQLQREYLPQKTHEIFTDTLEVVLAVVHDGMRIMDHIFGDRPQYTRRSVLNKRHNKDSS